MDADLPLFAWTPPTCRFVPFPLAKRVGKIRDVALKLSEKVTEKHAAYYREQVEHALRNQLSRLGVSDSDQAKELAAFWSEVTNQMARLAYQRRGEAS